VNVANVTDFRLLVTWMTAALLPRGPYPVLALNGEAGSSKSTLTRIVRSLVDPSAVALRGAPKDIRDLVSIAKNNHVIALDNLSHVGADMADQLCRLATGGGVGGRKLYEDTDEAVFEAQRPIIMNGIGELATRGDLADRTIVLPLPQIIRRLSEQELWADFDDSRSDIFGMLLNLVVKGQARLAEVRARVKADGIELPRMADFALWGLAVAPALGWTESEFLDAYKRNSEDASAAVLESDVVGVALLRFFNTRDEFDGTASELLEKLESWKHAGAGKFTGYWPKTPEALSQTLRRLTPALRKRGIHVQPGKRTKHSRSWSIRADTAEGLPALQPLLEAA
jgi:hypothetical protein